MLLSWGPVVQLRSIARSIGLTRLIGRLRAGSKYEERFGDAMLAALRPGDVVWDIGANVGFYSAKFAQGVGPGGKVVAFEPVPLCFRELAAAVAGCPNVRAVNAGLGIASGRVTFDVGDGTVNPNARIVEGPAAPGASVLELPIYAGEDAATALGLPPPTFAKVDVEGFELDVLRGMRGLLGSANCHDVFVEVHFGLLAQRRLPSAPDQIVTLLKDLGYKVAWVDASHVHASRAR